MPWIYNTVQNLDDLSSWKQITAVAVALTVLMSAVVIARLWLRLSVLGSEDWLVVTAAICSIIYNALCIMQTRYGLGLPIALRPHMDVGPYTVVCKRTRIHMKLPADYRVQYNYAGRPFYLIGIACFKISLCIGYLRFTARTTDFRFRRLTMAVIAFVIITSITFMGINLFSCIPLSKIFDRTIPGKCLPYSPANYYISACIIAADVTTFTLPIRLISPLSLPWKKKVQVCALFALGLSTTAFSILRMASIYKNANGSGDLTDLVQYGCIEINVGIITSCLPFVRRSGDQKTQSNSRHTYELERTNHSQSGGKVPVEKDEIGLRSDCEGRSASEESITGICNADRHGWEQESDDVGIVKTIEFQVRRI
ncbi:hypothetical protein K461DRAFT_15086 [Myriangium duriaei CBS 260.36]|uniref:Rhodopsin domain-containing protein n=1 Tax=Myriangium duriaei CBS 260.36 TaxID=1168546 RepID=A0A9P4JAZ5_9PEZI|nr:hypothetical protein K461DRAFT_15086 [Myriangium duriaei CBS 260.36]